MTNDDSNDILHRIEQCGVVAVIRLDSLDQAVPLAKALIAGGVTVIEFTMTNPAAVQAIAAVRSACGDACLVGAGSVINAEMVNAVHGAGTAFVVSPTTSAPVIERSQHHNLPVMPGAYTPTEIQHAWELGADVVKVFPARGLGPKYIKDVLAPLPHLRLMPTGGISAENIGSYIKAGVIAAGVGGALVDATSVHTQDWDTITARAQALTQAVQQARGE